MRKVEIIACVDNQFIESLFMQINHRTYLTGDKLREDGPIVREYIDSQDAESYYNDFLLCATTYNSLDLKPIL